MILLTGGTGVLGRELLKLNPDWIAPLRDKLDLTFPWPNRIETYIPESIREKIKLIIHCAAYTDLRGAEEEKELCYKTNVMGTRQLASVGIPMIYISTEYVFDGEKGNYAETDYPNPQNFYSFTKLLGEYESRTSPRSVVIRCLFKPRPFEHLAGCVDQFTSGSYVDVIAKEIALAVEMFDDLPSTLHIGTGKKSTFELARESRPDIRRITRAEIRYQTGLKLPKDTSLDTTLWESLKNGK